MSRWNDHGAQVGPNWLVDSLGRLVGYRDKLGNDYQVATQTIAGGAESISPGTQLPPGGGTVRTYRGSVGSQAAMLALSTSAQGDWCIRTDLSPNQVFELTALPAATLGNWVAYPNAGGGGGGIAGPGVSIDNELPLWSGTGGATLKRASTSGYVLLTSGVVSVQSAAALKTALSLTSADVGLGNVDNTSDVNKPVSTAQAAYADAKVVNNMTGSTSVAPSKTAVQTAIDAKVQNNMTASTVLAPTVTAVQTAIDAKVQNNLVGSTTVAPSASAVNTALSGKLDANNGVTTGTGSGLTLNGDPTSTLQAVTKQYVDNLVQGLKWKANVKAATTVNGALATAYENGDVIDSVTLATGDRILLKNQTTGSENGVYTVNATGAPTRATDMDTGVEFISAVISVDQGASNADTSWRCTNDTVTVGSTSVVFAAFGAGSGITDGDKGDVVVSGGGTVWTLDTTPNSNSTAVLFFAPRNTLVLSGGNATLTVGDSPTAGRGTGLRITGDSVARTVTLPAGTWRSSGRQATITSFSVPANWQGTVYLEYQGSSTYDVSGEPIPIAQRAFSRSQKTGANETAGLFIYFPQAGTIDTLYGKTNSGTITVQLVKNGSNMGSSLAVTSTRGSQAIGVAVAAGDVIEVTYSSNSSAVRTDIGVLWTPASL